MDRRGSGFKKTFSDYRQKVFSCMTEIKVSAAGRTLEIGGKDTFSLTVILYLLAMASIAIKKELFSTSIFRNSLVAFLQ